MKAVLYSVLVDANTDPRELPQRLLGLRGPYSTKMSEGILGIAELDNDGVPVEPVFVRPGVQWEGLPVEKYHCAATEEFTGSDTRESDVVYTMSTVNCGGPPVSNTRQSVTVYESQCGVAKLVASGWLDTRDGVPESARVVAAKESLAYVMAGPWLPTDTRWVCPARIEAI